MSDLLNHDINRIINETFDDGRAEGHDGADEQPSCLRPLPRDAAVLGRRAEQLLAHVEDELAPRVRDSQRRQPEKSIGSDVMKIGY